MRFEERDLKPYAESVSAAALKEGSVYYSVSYIDEEMLIPTMETLVFIGRDLRPGDSGQVYFQDVRSYSWGIRYETATGDDCARFSTWSEKDVGGIFEFERALEALMGCSLRRRKAGWR